MMETVWNKVSKDPLLSCLLPTIVIFLLHLIFNWSSQTVSFVPDEAIQLSYARTLAGGQPIIFIGDAHSNFGYALLLVPLFWLFDNPEIIFRLAIVINALLLASLYPALLYILKKVSGQSPHTNILIAFLAACYPSFFLTNHVVWAENILIPLLTWSVVLLLLFLEKNTYRFLLYFVLSVGFLYTSHIRALAILLAAAVFVGLLWLAKRINFLQFATAIFIWLAFYFGTNFITQQLVSLSWQNLLVFSTRNIWQSLAHLELFFSALAGQIWYLIVATYGLFFFGGVYMFKYLADTYKQGRTAFIQNNQTWLWIFIILTFVASFLLSVVFISSNLAQDIYRRGDFWIYGRYNEIFIHFFIIAGLLYFYQTKVQWRYLPMALGLLLAAALPLFFWQDIFIDNQRLILTIPSIIWWERLLGGLNIKIISTIAGVLIIAAFLSFGQQFKKGYLVICALFFLMTLACYDYVVHRDIYKSLDLLPVLESLQVDNLAYYDWHYNCNASFDTTERSLSRVNYYAFQYRLPDTKVIMFASGQNPPARYVVAPTCWSEAQEFGGQIIAQDRFQAQALWQLEK